MADNEKASPAVKSMRKEQAEQKRRPPGELEQGLEHTFPASDPVSVTRSSIPTGQVDPAKAAEIDAAESEQPAKSDPYPHTPP
ncbi:hypothetical protein [Rhizobium sp. TRM96647]|uniref:hypothetical protein n=1 Tax=unclassified Rhizobium TaxID=2613769 RepID=UPI0039920A13